MARKKPNNKKPSEVWKKYKEEGGKLTRGKTCPKCEPGDFLADHKDRLVCGKCHYVEIKSQDKPEEKKE